MGTGLECTNVRLRSHQTLDRVESRQAGVGSGQVRSRKSCPMSDTGTQVIQSYCIWILLIDILVISLRLNLSTSIYWKFENRDLWILLATIFFHVFLSQDVVILINGCRNFQLVSLGILRFLSHLFYCQSNRSTQYIHCINLSYHSIHCLYVHWSVSYTYV